MRKKHESFEAAVVATLYKIRRGSRDNASIARTKMKKKFKGMACVYCLARATTDDHVIARAFFLESRRERLPEAPACQSCNAEKARLEGHLAGILPFGGRHADARENMARLPARIARNPKLRRMTLSPAMEPPDASGGKWTMTGALPIDADEITRLFIFIVKGLAFHHWHVHLNADDTVYAGMLSSTGAPLFEQLLAHRCRDRKIVDLGISTFKYEGCQSAESPRLTMWRVSLYGLVMEAGPEDPGERAYAVYGLTAPGSMAAGHTLARLLRGEY